MNWLRIAHDPRETTRKECAGRKMLADSRTLLKLLATTILKQWAVMLTGTKVLDHDHPFGEQYPMSKDAFEFLRSTILASRCTKLEGSKTCLLRPSGFQ